MAAAAAAAAVLAAEDVVPVVASLSDSTSEMGVTVIVGDMQGRSNELDLSEFATVADFTFRGDVPRIKIPPDFGGEGIVTGAICNGGEPRRIPIHESPSVLVGPKTRLFEIDFCIIDYCECHWYRDMQQ